MNQADFYLIDSPRLSDLNRFCCRLVEKAYHQGMKIHIQAANPQQAEDLNDMLWNFQPESFIPHGIGQGQHEQFPVTIDVISLNQGHRDLLVLLAPNLPDNFVEFTRIAIVTPNIDSSIQQSRMMYRQIQSSPISNPSESGQENITANIHDMRKK